MKFTRRAAEIEAYRWNGTTADLQRLVVGLPELFKVASLRDGTNRLAVLMMAGQPRLLGIASPGTYLQITSDPAGVAIVAAAWFEEQYAPVEDDQ